VESRIAALGRFGPVFSVGIGLHKGYGELAGGSTDVGDVSYVVPTAQCLAVTSPIGTPGHSWQNLVSVGSGIGRKGMLLAARVLAAATCNLMRQPELIGPRKEFQSATIEALTCRLCRI
jgi:hypothetical protein